MFRKVTVTEVTELFITFYFTRGYKGKVSESSVTSVTSVTGVME